MFEGNKNNKDIGKNLKMVEFLKCELLNTIALLFETMVKGLKNSQELVLECLVNILLVTYTLGKRLGFDYSTLDRKLEEKIKTSILEEHHLEKWYGDLSSLNEHLNNHGK
ncbi:MazG-like family protein [Natronincola ferrireducens]|uniref:MazG-like family protein n=1 Tax=Natronincola ferrireducens TaxID=393762 RepID=A0A1G9HP20_9FIRM|nr:MazG-like family protein [Natronincola ferrireducens]SDL14680.1 MazG-like family protein [Natronincola ferrireducens]